MQRGYVKLWRKSLDSAVFDNPELWKFWTWCLMKASHKGITVLVGYQEVHLEPGQFIFGRMKAAAELKLSEKKVRTFLEFLKTRSKLAIKTASKYSIVSIMNWDIYQGDDEVKGPAKGPAKGPSKGHQRATNKNVKNEKKKHISSQGGVEPSTNPPPTPQAELSMKFLEHQHKAFPNVVKAITNQKVKDGAETIRKLMEIDGYDLDRQIKPALRWAVQDDFWKDKLLSLSSLRQKSKNGETKFVNLLASMNGSGANRPQKAKGDPEWY